MATNTTYNPPNVNSFVKSALNFNAQGILATVIAGSVQNIDYQVSGDQLITGAYVLVQNGSFGDHVSFQVVDTQGLYAPPGTMLNQFVSNWYIQSDSELQADFEINYPAKILSGLTLRLIYTSVGSNNPSVAINYLLHEVLE